MLTFAIIVGVASIGSFVLVAVGGSDPPGSTLEAISTVAVGIWFGTIATATVVAILKRRPAL
jgi:hypothetical protein